MASCERQRYIQRILHLYRETPGTRGRSRAADRRLAEQLFRRGTDYEIVRAAMLLAAARRNFRDPEAEPLQIIASLHYFLPIIRELEAIPLEPEYVEYLQHRLAGL